MRRHRKYKIRRIAIIATILLLILFGAFLIKERLGEPSPGDEENPSDEIDESENKGQDPTDEDEESRPVEEDPKEEPAEEPVEDPEDPQEEPDIIGSDESPDQAIIIKNPEKIDVLVNRKYSLPDYYVPEDLVKLEEVPTVLENPEVNQLRSVAYEALKEMFSAANEEEGYQLYARSGYRSYNTQVSLYSSYVGAYGQEAADKFSAKAGQSEHQTGLSIDITCQAMNYSLDEGFGEIEEGIWVAENAHRFGYIIRYPKGKEDITGYSYEPWHMRYVGVELAQDIYESQVTMEEYYQMP